MLAVVVAGGELIPSARALEALRAADLVIAADSGLRHLPALGRAADLAVGDFDSIAVSAAADARILRFPVAKDLTDTHIAVIEAVRAGATQIRLLAALRGPRLDHGAANLLLLAEQAFRQIDLRAIDGDDELRAVRRAAAIFGAAGDLVTLLALSQQVTGITTHGLAYALSGATLRRGASRGVSNVLEGDEASVMLRSGTLLLVHRRGGDPNALTGNAFR